jgi:hypothetical protein
MSNLGTLTLDLVAKISGFTGPLDKAERQSKKNADGITRHQREVTAAIGSSVKSLVGWAAGFVAFGAMKSFVTNSLEAAGAIKDVSDTAGITTDTLQEMRHVTSMFGVSAEQADQGLQKFNKSIGELRAGSGSLYSYLTKTDKALLSQVQSARSTDDALDLVFKSMNNVADSSERSTLAVAAFGKSGQRMAIMAGDYENLRKEARDLGLVIESSLIENADEAGDKLDTMAQVIKTQLMGAVLDLAPALQSMAQAIIDIAPGISWLMGGEDRSNERLADLQATTAEIQNLNSLLKEQRDIQTRLTALKGKGSWYNPDELKQAENNIQSIIESIKELNGTKMGAGTSDGGTDAALSQQQSVEIYKKAFSELETITQKTYDVMKSEYQSDLDEFSNLTGDKLTAQAIYNKNMKALNEKLSPTEAGDTGWTDAGRLSDDQKRWMSIFVSGNNEINAIKDEQVDKDIERQVELRQLIDQANIAELNNKYSGVDKELALHKYKYDKLRELYTVGSEELTEIERAATAERAAIVTNNDYWSGYLESLESNIASMDEIVGGSLDDLTSKFGNFLSAVIVGNEDAGEAFKKLATEMASSMLAAIGKMIAQWLIYEVTKTAIDKGVQAAAAPSLIANAQSGALLAGINAYASAAAIPYTGWVLAPGAMAAALAVTEPMAAAVAGLAVAGMAHEGIDSVPETGTWLLQKGERVVSSKTSKRLDDTLDRINYGTGNATSNNRSMVGAQREYSEPHFHQHFDGPVFLNRSHIKDVTRMFMDEFEKERTRVGAVR